MPCFKYLPRLSKTMPDEPFMLVSLAEAKAKKLAQVLNNETCTKILNHLANGKDGTETEIAKALKLPLSTVHYNLKQLVETKLVIADEFHYSEKGREVNHYRLANKYIIIAPHEEREPFLRRLRGFLPAAIITAGAALVLKLLGLFNETARSGADLPMLSIPSDAAPEMATEAARAAPEMTPFADGVIAKEAMTDGALRAIPEDGIEGAMEATNEAVNETFALLTPTAPFPVPSDAVAHAIAWNEVALAFLVGGLFALLMLALTPHFRRRVTEQATRQRKNNRKEL